MDYSNSVEILDTEHKEYVRYVAFDHFGKRLATCSSDKTIKIWQKSPRGNWIKACSFQAHDAPATKVKWAHPEQGFILASCASDNSVIIWEEKKKVSFVKGGQDSMISEEEEDYTTSFIQRAKFADSKESVEDIKFGPRHLNLMLATASADGYLRIYEAPDVFNLNQWKLNYEVQVTSLGINCISWNKNPFDSPMIVVGTKDAKSSLMDKNASKGQMMDQSLSNENLVAPLNEDKLLSVYACRDNRWGLVKELRSKSQRHQAAVNDVSWAQLNARSYHMIVSCGVEGVFVWYVRFEDDGIKSIKMDVLDSQPILEKVAVWKASWNAMSTLLAFSGRDGKARVCQCGYDKRWTIASEFQEDAAEPEAKSTMLFGKKGIF